MTLPAPRPRSLRPGFLARLFESLAADRGRRASEIVLGARHPVGL